MENDATFTYSYSASDNKEVQRIREKYLPREESKIEKLKMHDTKVKHSANVFAYVFGSISSIIMGAGMSLVMTDIDSGTGIENGMLPGIIIGVVGLFMALINYPVFKRILGSRKKTR